MTGHVENRDLAMMRVSYTDAGLDENELAVDWFSQFQRWMDQAVAAGLPEPNAMVLATASSTGIPSSRTVLAKAVDPTGVTFYTNYTSAKSSDLQHNPVASATFPWIALQRQVHVRGRVVQVDRDTTEAYWRTRPRGSQLGAWASPQSTVLGSFPAGAVIPDPSPRVRLDELGAEMEARFGATDADSVPVPPQWGGWQIQPESVEFWQGRVGRMHDRLRYRSVQDGRWLVERLAP